MIHAIWYSPDDLALVEPRVNASAVAESLAPTGTPLLMPLLTSTLTLWQVLSVLLIAGGVLAIVLVLRRPPSPPPPGPSTPDARQSAEQLEQILSEARELLHLVGQRADAQADRLEQLIAQADQRLEHLESALHTSADHVIESKPTERSVSAAHNEDSVPSPAAESIVARIYEMANQGLAPIEIARRTGQHAGKVELILALRSVGPRPER